MLYVRVFLFSSAGWKAFLNALCVAARFVSQLCRMPLGTFRLHHGNCLVSPNDHAKEGEVYCCNSSTSIEIANIILLTYLSCSGHFSLWIEMSCNLQQAAVKHHGAVRGSRICSLPLQPPAPQLLGRVPGGEALMIFSLKSTAFVLVIALELESKGRSVVANMGSPMMCVMPLQLGAALDLIPPTD